MSCVDRGRGEVGDRQAVANMHMVGRGSAVACGGW